MANIEQVAAYLTHSSLLLQHRISVPVSIQHGDNGGTVPLEWSFDSVDN